MSFHIPFVGAPHSWWQFSDDFFDSVRMHRNDEDEEIQQARRHYTQAEVDGCMLYKLYDDAHVKVSQNLIPSIINSCNIYASNLTGSGWIDLPLPHCLYMLENNCAEN